MCRNMQFRRHRVAQTGLCARKGGLGYRQGGRRAPGVSDQPKSGGKKHEFGQRRRARAQRGKIMWKFHSKDTMGKSAEACKSWLGSSKPGEDGRAPAPPRVREQAAVCAPQGTDQPMGYTCGVRSPMPQYFSGTGGAKQAGWQVVGWETSAGEKVHRLPGRTHFICAQRRAASASLPQTPS